MKPKKSICLIGFRGSGKSTVGSLLAERLSVDFYDSDLEIQNQFGISVNAFLKEHGESKFRRVEEEVLASILKKKAPMVLATGGGIVHSENNCKVLKTHGTVIYLFAEIEILIQRLSEVPRTPLTKLSLKEEVAFLLKQREPLYRKLADIVIDTGGHSLEECIDQILKFLYS